MRRNEVLEKINALVDLRPAERRLEATYSELGRPGHRASVLLRVMLLQHLYGLSDPQAEAQLGDRLSFQKFVGLRAGETAICRFRQRMIDAQSHERLLGLLNEQLAAAGYLVRRTMLVDTTLVESSRTRPTPSVGETGRICAIFPKHCSMRSNILCLVSQFFKDFKAEGRRNASFARRLVREGISRFRRSQLSQQVASVTLSSSDAVVGPACPTTAKHLPKSIPSFIIEITRIFFLVRLYFRIRSRHCRIVPAR
jgi:transposase